MRLARIAAMLPGCGLAFLDRGLIAYEVKSEHVHGAVSQITLAVALGLIVRNTVGVPAAYEAGLRLCMRAVLRVGIVIMGLTLSIMAVGKDALIRPAGHGLHDRHRDDLGHADYASGWACRENSGTLIAIGTSICGVSAIVATAPIIDADEDETAYAVACITIFGLMAMLCYPFVAHHVFDTAKQSGVFFGTAIHDMSQATAAGLAYSQQYEKGTEIGMHTSVSVKLVRNMWMSMLIPLAGIMYHHGKEAGKRVRQKWHQIIPLFVVGFLADGVHPSRSATPGTTGPLGSNTPSQWHVRCNDWVCEGQLCRAQWNWSKVGVDAKLIVPWVLATSMAAVGLGTGFAKLKNLGLKPFTVGLAAAVAAFVGIVSATDNAQSHAASGHSHSCTEGLR